MLKGCFRVIRQATYQASRISRDSRHGVGVLHDRVVTIWAVLCGVTTAGDLLDVAVLRLNGSVLNVAASRLLLMRNARPEVGRFSFRLLEDADSCAKTGRELPF